MEPKFPTDPSPVKKKETQMTWQPKYTVTEQPLEPEEDIDSIEEADEEYVVESE